MNQKMRMIRGDIDYDALDTEDPKIQKALDVAAKEVKYNTRLYEFLDMAYPARHSCYDYY